MPSANLYSYYAIYCKQQTANHYPPRSLCDTQRCTRQIRVQQAQDEGAGGGNVPEYLSAGCPRA